MISSYVLTMESTGDHGQRSLETLSHICTAARAGDHGASMIDGIAKSRQESSKKRKDHDDGEITAGCLVVANKNASSRDEGSGMDQASSSILMNKGTEGTTTASDPETASSLSKVDLKSNRKKRHPKKSKGGKSNGNNNSRSFPADDASASSHPYRDPDAVALQSSPADEARYCVKNGASSTQQGTSDRKNVKNKGRSSPKHSETHKQARNGDSGGSGSSKQQKLSQLDASQLQEPLIIRTHCSYQVRSEQKATHVLGLVFAVFVICWTPFFILNFLSGIMPDMHVPPMLSITFLWLGYVSSTMNPIIYTIFNRNFRTTFKKILLFQSLSVSTAVTARKGNQRSFGRGRKTKGDPNSVTAIRSPDYSRNEFSNYETA